MNPRLTLATAARILRDWESTLSKFKKVMPHDYKRALKEQAEAEAPLRATDERDALINATGRIEGHHRIVDGRGG